MFGAALAALSLSKQGIAVDGPDPEGWTTAKWGMTQEQISQSFPQAALYLDKYDKKPVLGLNGISMGSVGSMPYSVRFFFTNGGLTSVSIKPEGDPIATPRAAKVNLLDALTSKYGSPLMDAPKRDSSSVSYTWNWIFAKTVIELGYNDFGFPSRPGLTHLFYSFRQPNAAL
jgi:hypothetical protein